MATYNRGYIIAEALESAFAQSFSDFEVLVVDDSSQDNTAEVVGRFQDPRLRYIRLEKNAGYSAATNRGFAEARGEWVSFLDSDDVWKPDKLAVEMEFVSRQPEVGAVFSDLEKYDGSHHEPSFMHGVRSLKGFLAAGPYPQGVSVDRRFMHLALLREVFVKPLTLTFRRELLSQTGNFDETLPAGSDWMFILRLSAVAPFGYIDRPTAVMRVMSDATHRGDSGARGNTLIVERLAALCRTYRADHEARRAARWGISDVTKQLGWHYLATGNRKSAAAAFLRGSWYARNPGLAARAAAAVLPGRLDGWLRALLRRQNGGRKTDDVIRV